MSVRRLQARVPSARVAGIGVLLGHRLAFHKCGRDGSAKCDVAAGAAAGERVFGVLYRMDPGHRAALDAIEGLGLGYALKLVTVQLSDDTGVRAFTYCATRIDASLKPFSWYKEHVLRGAREHGLPRDYLAAIAATEAVQDPDETRHQAELTIYED